MKLQYQQSNEKKFVFDLNNTTKGSVHNVGRIRQEDKSQGNGMNNIFPARCVLLVTLKLLETIKI